MAAHPKAASIEEHKTALKEKYKEAKSTGARVNDARSIIGKLKSEIESRRVQNAMHSISEGKSEVSGNTCLVHAVEKHILLDSSFPLRRVLK